MCSPWASGAYFVRVYSRTPRLDDKTITSALRAVEVGYRQTWNMLCMQQVHGIRDNMPLRACNQDRLPLIAQRRYRLLSAA